MCTRKKVKVMLMEQDFRKEINTGVAGAEEKHDLRMQFCPLDNMSSLHF